MTMRAGFAALAAFSILSTPALAADAEAPAGYIWTGAYLGAQAGYGWGDADYHYDPVSSRIGLDFDGFVGGITAGYNRQYGEVVIGGEIDISYADFEDFVHPTGHGFANDAPCLRQGCSLEISWFGTARAKLGYAMDTIMPFVTGGFSFAAVEGRFDPGACLCKIDDAAFGWAIGGGLEWAFEERWSVKAEYLYVDLGEPDIDGTADISDDVSTSPFDFSVVRLGVNYRL